MAEEKKINKKNLENTVITAQVDGVRKSIYDSVLTGLTPAKLGNLIKDAKNGKTESYLTLAEEMEERDAQYRTVLNTRKLQIISTPYIIKTVDNQDKNLEKIQAFVENITRTPQFKKMLFHLLDGLGKGFSVVEINYEYDEKEKLLYPKTYSYKPQAWFTFKDEELVLRTGEEGQTQELESIKVIRHIPQLKSGIPIRGGLAYAVASIFILKNYGIKDWGTMVEVFGMPIRLGKYDTSMSDDTNKAELMKAVSSIGTDYAAIIPEGMNIEFKNGDVSTNGDLYLKYIEHLNEQMSKVVLGQTMTTDSGSSLSQAQIHNITREIIQRADCIDLADTINRDLIKPIVDLNFGEQDFYPYIEFDTAEKEDKQSLKDIALAAHSIGIPFSVADIRERLGLKEPADNKDTLKSLFQSSQLYLEDNKEVESLNFDDSKAELNGEDNNKSNEDQIDIDVEKELED